MIQFTLLLISWLLLWNIPCLSQSIQLTEAFPHLKFKQITELVPSPDTTSRIFLLEQEGRVRVFLNHEQTQKAEVFLDISNKIISGGEKGLLGIAFHPSYTENGYFYLYYTKGNPLKSVISQFQVSKHDPNLANPNSEVMLLTIDQPYGNHNGGKIAFGKDGFLYISLGDGGSAGDPLNHAQDKSSFLGKILRIDVDHKENGKNYAIPKDNPFYHNKLNFKKEIYAYGLRNTWKFSIHPHTGKIWGADVGQDKIEEINIIEKGKNYGWRRMEGSSCYNPTTHCNKENLTLPIFEYPHASGNSKSITGGYHYFGESFPHLKGKYIYADYVSGNIWALTYEKGMVTNQKILKTKLFISSFGLAHNNEIFICSFGDGKIYKMINQ
jgi:glucose/arabinose dehydrogenase